MLPVILAGAGIGIPILGGMAGYNQNKGNAELARVSALAKRDAIDRNMDKLMRDQRQTVGTARAVMAKRSGYGQDQSLMLEGMMLNRMSRDMAELDYQKSMTGIEGRYQASSYDAAATASIISAGSKAAGQAYSGYMAYRDYAPAGEE